jgi:hypothetical protein
MAGQSRVQRNEKIHENSQSWEQFSDSENLTPDLRTSEHERHALSREALTKKFNSNYGCTYKKYNKFTFYNKAFRTANSHQHCLPSSFLLF